MIDRKRYEGHSTGEMTTSRTDMLSYTNNPETGQTEFVVYIYREGQERLAIFGENARADAELYADAPLLLAEVDRLTAENATLRRELEVAKRALLLSCKDHADRLTCPQAERGERLSICEKGCLDRSPVTCFEHDYTTRAAAEIAAEEATK